MILESRIRQFYQQFISLKGDPLSLAWGVAMGVFIGVTPTIPFHTVLIIVFGFLLRKNMTSAYLGSWLISNPLTIPLLYISEYQIGRLILGRSGVPIRFEEYSVASILRLGGDIAIPLLLGGLVLAFIFAVPAYFLSYRILSSLRKKETHEIRPADSP